MVKDEIGINTLYKKVAQEGCTKELVVQKGAKNGFSSIRWQTLNEKYNCGGDFLPQMTGRSRLILIKTQKGKEHLSDKEHQCGANRRPRV